MPTDRPDWILEARRELERHAGLQLGPVHVWVWYDVSGEGVEHVLVPGEGGSAVLYIEEHRLPQLHPRDLPVLRALAERPGLTGKQIAGAIGAKDGGALRGRLARLRHEAGVIARGEEGYELTARGRALLRLHERGRTVGA
jgi:hypothetical protein